MRFVATPRFRSLLLLTLAVLALGAARADAQVNPLWDHYKMYETPPFSLTPPVSVNLTDQFGPFGHQVQFLERFMNPVEKQVLQPPPGGVFPIHDPLIHYTWWRLSPQPYSATVTAVNQFGDHTIQVHDGVYLLNPTLKNQPGGTIPPRNHYKCYDCQGPPVSFVVRMVDQFGTWQAEVGVPRWFCNPVEKKVDGQPLNPIVDPNQHYICYEFQPPDPNLYSAVITDQFVTNLPRDFVASRWLCVPTYKTGVTASRKDTWGQLKQLYR